ncbi:MAG TPA: hypothetical protein VG496_04415 [Myxococcales bacterium]|nr:hypothetical protein [Myxococcales bacterium]
MRRVAALLLPLTCACSTTINIQRPVSSDATQRLEALLRDQVATVAYVPHGDEVKKELASGVAVNSEKVQWVRWESERAQEIGSPRWQRVEAPIDAVREISMCEPGCRGKGALIGAGVGLGLGLLFGAIMYGTCKTDFRWEGNLCAYWFVPGPPVGILIGSLVGGLVGTHTVIAFERAAAAK